MVLNRTKAKIRLTGEAKAKARSSGDKTTSFGEPKTLCISGEVNSEATFDSAKAASHSEAIASDKVTSQVPYGEARIASNNEAKAPCVFDGSTSQVFYKTKAPSSGAKTAFVWRS